MKKLNKYNIRSRRFEALVFESSGHAHTKVKQLIRLWESEARKRLGPEHRASVWQGRSSSRITLSTIIHYWCAIAVLSFYRIKHYEKSGFIA